MCIYATNQYLSGLTVLYRIWAVVKFPTTNEVELAPHEWLASEDGEVTCLWPSHLTPAQQRKVIQNQKGQVMHGRVLRHP